MSLKDTMSLRRPLDPSLISTANKLAVSVQVWRRRVPDVSAAARQRLQKGTINNAWLSAEAQKCPSGFPTHERSESALIHVSCYTTASCGLCCFLRKWAPLSRQVYITSLICSAWGSCKPNGCFCSEYNHQTCMDRTYTKPCRSIFISIS